MNRNVELFDFHISDLDKMNIHYYEGEDIKAYKERLLTVMSMGESKLIRYKGKSIAVMGYHIPWAGVCELWIIPEEPIKDKGILALTLKHSLELFILPLNCHRIQATVLENDPSEHFLLRLGFKSEGVLQKYDAFKQNYKMWARVH